MKKRAITIGVAAVAASLGTLIKAQTWYFPSVSVISNNDPVFTFSVNPGSPSQGCIVYNWNFGDGNTTTTSTPTVTHTYSNNGNYYVSVCPVDSCVAASYSCNAVSVTVSNASNPPTLTCSASLNMWTDSLVGPGNYVYTYYYSPSNANPIQYNWYVWGTTYPSGTYTTSATGSSPMFNLSPGTYSICLQIVLLNQAGTDTCTAWACAFVSDSVNNISVYKLGTTGVESIKQYESVSIYPNPARDNVYLKFTQNTNASIRIMDISGRIINEEQMSGNSKSINVSNLQNGIYYILIDNDKKQPIRKMIIKE